MKKIITLFTLLLTGTANATLLGDNVNCSTTGSSWSCDPVGSTIVTDPGIEYGIIGVREFFEHKSG